MATAKRKNSNKIVIISDFSTLEEYHSEYFKKYPKRTKKPIDKPWHPSINEWCILPRMQMNDLKQKWKHYTMWLCKKYNIENLNIEKCEITYKTFLPSKRRSDIDNYSPKFCQDGLVGSKVIMDDDYFHVNPLHIELYYDKNNPRMEIHIERKDKNE